MKTGLLPLPPDERDYQFGALYGQLEIPNQDFEIPTLGIKDQQETDFCTAHAVVTASECQELKKLSASWQFAKIKQLMGDLEYGADLRTACKSAVKFGSLPEEIAPYDIDDGSRDFLADWRNWNSDLDTQALIYKKKTYLSATGQDLFDSIRSVLWKFRNEKRVVITGVLWRHSWKSVISREYEATGFPHAFVFTGQTKINDEWYLIAQLSNGEHFGDRGRFYFPREVVNKECIYGNFVFVDLNPEEVKYLLEIGAKIKDNWLLQLIKALKEFLKSIYHGATA